MVLMSIVWTGYEAGNPPSNERYWDPYIHTKEGSKTYEGKFGEDIFSDFLIEFMKENKEDPMFMYYAMCLPHTPFVSTPLEPDVKDKMGRHKAMVRYVDFIVGKLLKSLDEMGLREKTMVILTTDNGTTGSIIGKAKGREVKGGKTKTTENGINGPFVVNAPGLVPAKTTKALADVTDLLPTFAELGGARLPTDYTFDGISFADVLLGKSERSQRQYAIAMGGQNNAKRTEKGVENMWYYRDRVIRDERYKLWISPEKKPVKLVDLSKDFLEKDNLIDNPEYKEMIKTMASAVADHFDKDLDPIYVPLKEESWDVPVKAESQTWKQGKPGEEVNYTPDSQVIKKAKPQKRK